MPIMSLISANATSGSICQNSAERYLTDEYFKKPVFVVNYPRKIKSFYMKQNPDGKTVAATDLLVPGVGEIIGCSERENDYARFLGYLLRFARECPLDYLRSSLVRGNSIVSRMFAMPVTYMSMRSKPNAIEVLKKSGKQFVYPVEWGLDLQTEHERYLTDEYFKKPVFVVNCMFAMPVTYMSMRSKPKPNPLCGTLPYLRKSR